MSCDVGVDSHSQAFQAFCYLPAPFPRNASVVPIPRAWAMCSITPEVGAGCYWLIPSLYLRGLGGAAC